MLIFLLCNSSRRLKYGDKIVIRIKIEINDDPDWEPDEDFYIRLLDEVTQKRLEGDDTECKVTIIDEDKPGSIGFPETQLEVRRKD